jgi:hypothetical protein
MMRIRRPLKKSIGIVGEGLTERMYFDYEAIISLRE